jgi:hypothetical protein
MKICPEMLSPYCKQLSEDLKLGTVAVPNLVHNLNDKTKYIVHYRNINVDTYKCSPLRADVYFVLR